MEQQSVGRACPACGSTDYLFRNRKKLPANPETGEPEQWETKRRCTACGKEWKEKEVVRAGRTSLMDEGGAC